MNKSLKRNTLFNTIKTATSIIFPLLTYPYITRILSVDALGTVNFCQSIISYMTLIGGFGIREYAIRTGSQMRDDNRRLGKFSNQMFTINIIFSLISYFGLVAGAFLLCKDIETIIVIIILGISVLIAPFALDWFYVIFEDFEYITLRTIVFNILSLILLFVFVHKSSDLYLYVALLVISSSGSYLANFIHSRKYIRLGIEKNVDIGIHIRSLAFFFISNVASVVLMNSDITLLGLICDKHAVGLYGVPVKIISIIKQISNGLILAVMSRLSYYYSNDRESFIYLLNKCFSIILVILFPSTIGIILLRREAVLFVAGSNYLDAQMALGILSADIILAVLSNLFANCVLVNMKKEKMVMISVIVAASINVLLNFVVLRKFQQNGAALTTVIADTISFGIIIYGCKNILLKVINFRELKNIIVSNVVCVCLFFLVRHILGDTNYIIKSIIEVISYGIVYYLMMLLTKNKIVIEYTRFAIVRFRKVVKHES